MPTGVRAQSPHLLYLIHSSPSAAGAYYAAQLGIALKVKDHASRTFLFDLLGLLERMKTDLGQNDAVHDEAASAAYVENFAIRVFTMADVEDRKGNATRYAPSDLCTYRPVLYPNML